MPTNHIPHPHSSWASVGMVTTTSLGSQFQSLTALSENKCFLLSNPNLPWCNWQPLHLHSSKADWFPLKLLFTWQMTSPRLTSFTWNPYQLLLGAELLVVHLAGQLMEHLEAAGSCSAVLDVTAPGPSAGFPSHITRVWEGVFLRFCSLKNSFF